jgi:hypothetical protein
MTEAKPPAVVVDTTGFHRDLTLSKSSWLQTRLWALKGQLQLWVPEVVIRETVRHYSTQLDQHLAKMADADDALSKLSVGSHSHLGVDDHCSKVVALKAGYEQWLRERLGRVGATILPLPQMSHEEMLSRALREEKPFRIKGDGAKKGPDGYRDMLIWASVAEYSAAHLGTSDTLILVTRNHTDFCDDKEPDTVAAVLRADLGDAAPTVRRLAELDELAHLLPVQPQDAAEIKMQDDLATDGQVRTGLTEAVQREYEALADREIADTYRDERFGTGLDFDALRLPLENPRLRWLEADLRTTRATVYGTDPDYDPALILARVTVTAEADIAGYIHVSDYDETFDFSTSLVNDHMFEAEGSRLVVLHFNVGIDPDGSVAFLDLEKAVPAP